MNSKVSVLFLLLLFLAACAGSVQADIVRLRTGEVYEGKVKMGGGAVCEVRLRDGTVKRVQRADIESIEEGPCSWDLYSEKASACDYSDAKAIMALVEFCSEKGLWEEWRQDLEKIIEIDPDRKIARFLLDYKKKDDEWILIGLSGGEWSAEEYLRSGFVLDKKKRKWLSPDEAKRAAGLILFRGEWTSEAEKNKILAIEEAEAQRLLETKTPSELRLLSRHAGTAEEKLKYGYLAIKKEPNKSGTYRYLIRAQLRVFGDVPNSRMLLDMAEKACEKDDQIYVARGLICLYTGEYRAAEKEAKSAIAKYSKSGNGYQILGEALYYQGKLKEAVTAYKNISIEKWSEYGLTGMEAVVRMCIALRIQGETQEAITLLAEYCEIGEPIVDRAYFIQLTAITKVREEVLTDLRKYLLYSRTAEMRDARRRWLETDPAFGKFRDDMEFQKIISPEGSDTSDWMSKNVDSEDIRAKDIRKAAKKKKRTIETTGLVGRWGVLKTDNHYLFTNAPRFRVVEIGNRLEKLATILDDTLALKTKKGKEPILRIFRSKEEYTRYMSSYFRTPVKAAYFIPPTEEVVTWAPDVGSLDSVMPDIYVACVKQRLYADLGAPLPVWLTEGMGFYFSTARYDSKEFRFESGAPNSLYLSTFKSNHSDAARAPDLAFYFTQTRLGLDRTGVEGQAGKADLWGFMYFLMKSPDEKVKKILPGYFAALRDKKEQKEALKAIYANIDRQTLSKMMVEFINGL